MPVYEYECDQCGKTTEALRKMADADAPLRCESCGSERLHRKHSVFAAGGGHSQDTFTPAATRNGGGCCPCGDPSGPCNIG